MDHRDVSRSVARETAGAADADELQQCIAQAWAELLNDPMERKAISELLAVDARDLRPDRPPFEARFASAGFTAAEVLIELSQSFALGLAGAAAKDAGETLYNEMRTLWTRYMRDRVSPFGSRKLGRPVPDHEED